MAYKNYIFDLYGTLVDIHTNERKSYLWEKTALYMRFQGADYTAQSLKRAYYEGIREQRREKRGVFTEKMGRIILEEEIEVSFEELIPELYLKAGVTVTEEQAKDWAALFRALSIQHLALYEGAKELLIRLKEDGKKVFLLTNAQRLFTEPELSILGIRDCFDAVYYSSDEGFVKPSAYFYRKLLEEQCLDPQESVMVGNDDLADAWGAHNCGMDSIYLYTKQSPKPAGALPENCRRVSQIGDVDKNPLRRTSW
ncbi:MAG: HAD family hydrolase [Lachnospiraceae bacterium]|nr:HAD family hydrolase [Lachnospiraceae bacterium]